ncbi:hypothetical protein OP10G_2308 [Fimbriimonas ginsengisoli Gsoil 348]|uniref:Uncharacterized protein n=1 Tax=Fimbriimonas ginsengisoli Gsoil 348 TaxID=661478 RepID=A0A068NQH8_FIMGI|nr:hypothetical protein OP10G_2308 [Fimbriimonas ginsengisoli Gsoil 348]
MSSLVCWAGVDSRGTASIYIATDSRVSLVKSTDGKAPRTKWDCGQKAYASPQTTWIFGCVGHGFFAAQIIPRVQSYLEAIDAQGLTTEARVEAACKFAANAMVSAPTFGEDEIRIVMATREADKRFRVFQMICVPGGATWIELPLPSTSEIIFIDGSGSTFIVKALAKWRETSAANTTRAIYSALCDALLHQKRDPYSEGPPQLVGIYRIGSARSFGVIWRGHRYFHGIKVDDPIPTVDWRNELFEVCDPSTLRRTISAQRHSHEVTRLKRKSRPS